MNNSSTGSILVGLLLLAAAIGVGGYVVYKVVGSPKGPDHIEIDAQQIDIAKRNMDRLFESAQNNFIHRSKNQRMARSITELGDGFEPGRFGCLIYPDIWVARMDNAGDPRTFSKPLTTTEEEALARPYRYAILPVEGVYGPEKDPRTTCIVAVPVTEQGRPILLMVAGPVINDPLDFRRKWPIHEIKDNDDLCRSIREMATKGIPMTSDILQKLPSSNRP